MKPYSPDNKNTEITSKEFELLVKSYLKSLGKDVKSLKVIHNTTFNRNDGNYQIDVYAEFVILGVIFKVLVECKKHKNPIKREVVQLLFDKIRATGSHKGIIFSTSGFQKGAIIYANKHGIALIRLMDGRCNYFTKGQNDITFELPSWIKLPKFIGEFKNGNSTTYLEKGYLDDLADFLFSNIQ